ncbi:MAG: FtsX-like permease family protein [Cytophagales bacterium]|nr:FtsX-like permease family protein [Cytophagales bacterium]
MNEFQELPQPPQWPYECLKKLLRADFLEELSGDVEERFHENLTRHSMTKARRLYVLDNFKLLRPQFFKSLGGDHQLNSFGMFQNYFKIGIRNILKYRLFSAINIFGLAAAMSVCMFIILMLVDQKSYDNFHQEEKQLYRIVGQPEPSSNTYATTSYAIGETLPLEYGIIDQSATLRRGLGGEATYEQKAIELRGYFATKDFLACLQFPLIEGDPNTALEKPNSLIISQTKAKQLFGEVSALGKSVQFHDRGLNILEDEGDTPPEDWGNLTITGIIDDQAYRSHLKFDALASATTLPALHRAEMLTDLSKRWESYYSSYNYVRLKEGIGEHELNNALVSFTKNKYGAIEGLEEFVLSAQNIRDITPGPIMNNESSFRLPMFIYYILSILAAIILLMAVINYTNLSVARSLIRAKEIGIRKVNGASRKAIAFQFLTESIITTMLALVLAVVLLSVMKNGFLTLWANKYLQLELDLSPVAFLLFFLFALMTGVVAGIYPSLVLSRKRPVDALTSHFSPNKKSWNAQKILNVSQLAVSLLFIVSSMVVYNQFRHYLAFEYGFNAENVLTIPLQSNDWQQLKTEMGGVSGVEMISACEYLPATGITDHMELEDKNRDDEYINLQVMRVDESFLENLGVRQLAGSPILASDERSRSVIINETAAKKLGFEHASEAVGTIWKTKQGSEIPIKGVVADFRSTLLINEDETRPLALTYRQEAFNFLNVRIAGNNQPQTIKRLEAAWKSVDPKHPFIYAYFDQELANTNLFILDIVTIIGYLAFLAIVIACLGLLGLATYTTQRRTKEVGVRKVLGAGEWQVVLVLSRNFIKLVLFAVILSAPLTYFINRFWLDHLPNRADFSISTVILGAVILLTLGLLTIGTQTFRIARLNPVMSLKDE